MTKRMLAHFCLWSVLIALIAGCAAKEKIETEPVVQPMSIATEGKEQRVDNFLVILDTSASKLAMTGKAQRTPPDEQSVNLLLRAKRIVHLMNKTIPDELDLQGGLRIFGEIGTDMGKQDTVMLYGMTDYSESELEDALNRAPNQPKGLTYMGKAIDAASLDLRKVSGKTAIILVSDGITPEDDPVRAAADLSQTFGQDVCIYGIHIGAYQTGRALLERVSQQAPCGFVVEDTEVETPAGMAGFVEKVFLAEPAPPKPEPKPVVKKAPVDVDGDGLADDRDMCPNTPKQADVDARGCWTIENVLFDFDKYTVKAEFHGALQDLAAVLRRNQDLTLTVHGHTDSIGTEEYNMNLSKNRAEAVERFITRLGIDEQRISIQAHGESDPVASNETDQGRMLNRRAVMEPSRR